MTSSNDFDRRLDGWLEDGPTRAPEQPIDLALAHARTHPRRRDPLAVLRRDPMGAAGGLGSGIGGALPLVAALGLLLVAALAVATVGGSFDRGPAIVPPISPVPSATALPAPSASPTAVPPAIPTAALPSTSPATVHVDLIDPNGADASIDIVDGSGTLVHAESGTPGDGASVEDGKVDVKTDLTDPDTLVLTWTGFPCYTGHALTIAPDSVTMTIDRLACSSDAIGIDHVLRLTFDGPVDPAAVKATVVTTGS